MYMISKRIADQLGFGFMRKLNEGRDKSVSQLDQIEGVSWPAVLAALPGEGGQTCGSHVEPA